MSESATAAPPSGGVPDLASLLYSSTSRTRAIFSTSSVPFSSSSLAGPQEASAMRMASKVADEYEHVKQLPAALLAQQSGHGGQGPVRPGTQVGVKRKAPEDGGRLMLENGGTSDPSSSTALALRTPSRGGIHSTASGSTLSTALMLKKEAAARQAKPAYHAPWKLSRVISGHLGWVRCIAVEPDNKWFATGAGDKMIKIWDLASGDLKLTLTGHISTVRGLAVSDRHPYLFSAGEDKTVKCWDLETNKVIRHYFGHLSGIYCLALHPTLDVLVTAGRDSSARVWDIRTKAQVHVLTGHSSTVASVQCQEADPQVITGSMDSTIRLWDLAAGKSMTTLTHHKKSVRTLATHPQEFSFASGSSGGSNIKTWRCPEATLLNSFSHPGIVNTLSVNPDGVLFSGTDAGSLQWADYATGVPFQSGADVPQPGSLDSEAGVFCSAFDRTGTRLITGGPDKTVKIYKEAS